MRGTPESVAQITGTGPQDSPSPETTTGLYLPYFHWARERRRIDKTTLRWRENRLPDGNFAYGSGTNLKHQLNLLHEARSVLNNENEHRALIGMELLDQRLAKLVLGWHDTHEGDLEEGDLPYGTKTKLEKEREYAAIDGLVLKIQDPLMLPMAQRAAEVIKHPSLYPEGRFLKAMEQIDHLKVALTIRDQAVLGNQNHIIKPHELLWDILYNNTPKLLDSLPEFPTLTRWVVTHKDELIQAIREFHTNAELSNLLRQSMQRHSPKRTYYPDGVSMVQEMATVLERLSALQPSTVIETVNVLPIRETPVEQQLEDRIIELEEGRTYLLEI